MTVGLFFAKIVDISSDDILPRLFLHLNFNFWLGGVHYEFGVHYKFMTWGRVKELTRWPVKI